MDRVALVTGGAQGIGLAVAQGLIRDGWSVGVIDVQDAPSPGPAGLMLPPSVCYRPADVSDPIGVTEAIEDISRELGPIAALVNNAGIYPRATVAEIDYRDWLRVIEVNLGGAFNCAKAFAAQLGTVGSGTIVNVSSAIAFQGAPRGSHYAASKAGVVGLTRALAVEFAPRIRVNAVVPGVTDTAQVRAGGRSTVELLAYARESVPLGRLCEPEDIFRAIRFLIGPDSSYITGQTLFVTGGSYMH